MTRVLVLGAGPDAEREVSIASATAVHAACSAARLDATLLLIDRPTIEQISAWETDVVFPVLHGPYGEGGEIQSLLAQARLPFVGSGFRAARLAMDKLATKLIAARLSIPTPDACVLDAVGVLAASDTGRAPSCPLALPVVVKPVAEGSSVGLHICHDPDQWRTAMAGVARDLAAHPGRAYMIERFTPGRELTASVLGDGSGKLTALPLIEIAPKGGVYDYDAKYQRTDTVYTVGPDLPDTIVSGIQGHALTLCEALGVRHLARVDFLLGDDGRWSLLEVNTMPGFTATSLLPKAAAAAGLPMPRLCAQLVGMALDQPTEPEPAPQQHRHNAPPDRIPQI